METQKKQSGQNPEGKKKATQKQVPVCNYAPEFAEHARFYREDEPCDDGHEGVPTCAEDESCPVTDDKMTEDVEELG